VNNIYAWTSTGTAADGPVYTDFLERVNGKLCSLSTCVGLGGHTDWRIPTVAELQSILLTPSPCGTSPCIDSIFVDPPTYDTAPRGYWSATTVAANPLIAHVVNFGNGAVDIDLKPNGRFVRGVRGGS